MKKIILLLLLPLATLMAVDFMMTREGLIPPAKIEDSSIDTPVTATDSEGSDKPSTSTADTISEESSSSTESATSEEAPASDDSSSTTVASDSTPEEETPSSGYTPSADTPASTSHSTTPATPSEEETPASDDSSSTTVASDSTPEEEIPSSGYTPSADTPASTSHSTTPAAPSEEEAPASDAPASTPHDTTATPEETHTVHSDKNPYLEPINLPKCDASNPEVQFIRKNADWKHINDKNKRIFCVSPGNYTALKKIVGPNMISGIKITSSGTPKKRRYILLNNGNNIHPAKLKKSQLANYTLELKGASYWVIDRAASFDVNFSHSFILNRNSTHNIFNRMFTQNLFHTMWIRNGSHYNTIQNSRFDGVSKQGALADLSTINLLDFGDIEIEIKGTKVINNEFLNTKAIRMAAESLGDKYDYYAKRQHCNYEGTIFDSNTLEFNHAGRTDCKGHYVPNGKCSNAEFGVEMKAGTDNGDNPLIITNNKQWGGRPTDPTFKTLSGKGGFSTAYLGTKNVYYARNVVFDNTSGISAADGGNKGIGNSHITIEKNIFLNCGERYRAKGKSALQIWSSESITVKNNLIVNPLGSWANVSGNYHNNYFGKNDIININTPIVYKNNKEPIKGIQPIDTNHYYKTPEAGGYTEDYVFTADKFTNNPRIIRLKNVIKPK